MAIETSLSYPDISAQGFAHPADRAAAAALHAVPMLDRVIKKLSEIGYERKLRQLMLGTAVRLGEDQLPDVWAMQRRYAHTFDIAKCPHLYVTQYPVGNALTIGANEPVTLVSSGLARSFDSDELQAVLAHEMGHVLADHVTFMTTFELVQLVMNGALRGAPLAGLPLKALYYALLEWSRAAELTADRASALGTGDPLLTCRTLMRMAGGPVPGLDLWTRSSARPPSTKEKATPSRGIRASGPRSAPPTPSPCAGSESSSHGWRRGSSTASGRVAISGGARSHRRRPSSTWRSSTTGNVSPRSSSGGRRCAAGREPLCHLARHRRRRCRRRRARRLSKRSVEQPPAW